MSCRGPWLSLQDCLQDLSRSCTRQGSREREEETCITQTHQVNRRPVTFVVFSDVLFLPIFQKYKNVKRVNLQERGKLRVQAQPS